MKKIFLILLVIVTMGLTLFATALLPVNGSPPNQSYIEKQSSIDYMLTSTDPENSPGSNTSQSSAVPTLPQTSLMYEPPPPVSALPVYNYNSALNQTRNPSAISSQSANIINFHAGKTTQFNPVNLNNYYDEALSYATNILKMPIYSNINT